MDSAIGIATTNATQKWLQEQNEFQSTVLEQSSEITEKHNLTSRCHLTKKQVSKAFDIRKWECKDLPVGTLQELHEGQIAICCFLKLKAPFYSLSCQKAGMYQGKALIVVYNLCNCDADS